MGNFRNSVASIRNTTPTAPLDPNQSGIHSPAPTLFDAASFPLAHRLFPSAPTSLPLTPALLPSVPTLFPGTTPLNQPPPPPPLRPLQQSPLDFYQWLEHFSPWLMMLFAGADIDGQYLEWALGHYSYLHPDCDQREWQPFYLLIYN